MSLADRKNVGLLVPSRNLIMEPDCYKYGPKGITYHTSRMRRDANVSNVDTNKQMLDYTFQSAELVAQAQVDLIVFGCTSGSIVNGPGGDLVLASKIQEHVNTPVITAATAVTEYLKAHGYKKIEIITPYVDDINEHEETFFKGSGFDVVKTVGMREPVSTKVPRISPEAIAEFCEKNLIEGVDAVFISCTNFRAMEAIEILNGKLGVPVTCSNDAILWAIEKYFAKS